MYNLKINGKDVSIEIRKDGGAKVLDSECEGRHFHSAIAPRGEKLFLLVDKKIIGIGMWSEDQETIRKMLEEYREV